MKKCCDQSYRECREWRKDVKKRGKVCRACRNKAGNNCNSQAETMVKLANFENLELFKL